jgi:hypothetical protein
LSRKRRRRRRFPLLWMAGVVACGLVLNAFLALRPRAIELRVRGALENALLCPFDFDSLAIGLFRGTELRGFYLEQPGYGRVARAGRIVVYPRLLALLAGRFEADLVLIRDLELTISRGEGGSWNLEQILRPRPSGAAAGALPSIAIESCNLRYVDSHSFPRPVAQELKNLRLALAAEPGAFVFHGQMEHGVAQRLEVSGRCELPPLPLRADIEVRASKIDLSSRFDHFLPQALAAELRSLNLQGSLDLTGSLQFDPENGLVPLRLAGSLIGCHVAPASLPFPLKGLSGSFLLRERTLDVSSLSGDFGGGKLDARGRLELTPGSWEIAGWSGKVTVDSVPIDRRLRDLLRPELRTLLDRFEPRGQVGIDVEVLSSQRLPPRLEEMLVKVRLQEVDFAYDRFPYRVEQAKGELLIESGRLTFHNALEAMCGGGRLTAAGGRVELRRGGAVDVTLNLEDIPLDERFRNALPAPMRRLWDDFEPRGIGDAVVQIERQAAPAAAGEAVAASLPRIAIRAFPREVSMVYRHFPYELRQVSGEVSYDSAEQRVLLLDLEGYHGEQLITGEGAIVAGDGGMLRIDLRSNDLSIDPALVNALSEDGRRLIGDFDLQGRIRAEVGIHAALGQKVQVTADINLLEGSIRHVKFPYLLPLAGGRLRLLGDHVIELSGFRTPPASLPSVAFDGSITSRGSERSILYRFQIDRLSVDRELVAALPPHLKKFATSIGLQGTYSGAISGRYLFDDEDPSKFSIHYAGSDISTEDGGVNFGLEFKSMVAKGSFAGAHSLERPHHFSGEVRVDSAWFNRLHLTGGEITFHFGEEHPMITLARRGERLPGSEYRPPARIIQRLTAEQVRDTFQISVHSSDLYGGRVDGFLYVDGGEQGDFAGDFIARELDVAKAAKDVFGVEGRNTGGKARGEVHFHGRGRDLASLRGEGRGLIQEARLVELPLFVGLLNILTLNFREIGEGVFFNEVVLPYRIEGGFFKSKAIEIKSPSLKLLGSGTLDFRGNLDLTLRPHFLELKIPIVEQVFSLLKETLTRVRVTGDLARPKVEFVTAAGLIRIPIEQQEPPGGERPLPRDLRNP